MPEAIYVNDTVRIKVKFSDFDSNGNPVDLEPVSVAVDIFKSDETQVVDSTASSLSSSLFYYDFTPTSADTYSIKFSGLLDNGSTVIVQQTLYVSSSTVEYKPTQTLGTDETIVFAPDVEPLYIDPDEILPYFPDATMLEIGEMVHIYSQEVKKLYKLRDDQDVNELPIIVYDYIKAAVACDLTRTYGFGGDDEVSISLGDLSINNRNVPRNTVTRDNASTWCQIATALRKELISAKVGPRAMSPKGDLGGSIPTSGGVRHPDTGKIVYLSDRELYGPGRKPPKDNDPMPQRDLRSYD